MKDQRSADLARIHILATEIWGKDDDAYRDNLFAVASVRSAAKLGHAGRQRVLEHFNNLARITRGEPAQAATDVPRNVAADRARLMGKIDAQLRALGKTRVYLEGSMLKRITGVDKLEFVTPDKLYKVVAALAMHQKRQAA
jgi:phage gp16-like protein